MKLRMGRGAASLNILNFTFISKTFGKPPLLQCGGTISLSGHTEWSLVVRFVWLWCGWFFYIQILILLLSRACPQYFLEVRCKHHIVFKRELFKPSFTYSIKIIITTVSVMLCNTPWSEGHVYILCIYDVKNETSWKQGTLYKTVTQSKIQNKLVSRAIISVLCHCCKWRVGLQPCGIYMFAVGFDHFSKIFHATFPPHWTHQLQLSKIFHATFPPQWTHHLQPLNVVVMGPF